jgi:prepilin-type N-terminal cleavage/methylation domain-containing protein
MKARGGYSLVEVMVAAVILAIGTLMLSATFMSAVSLNNLTEQESMAIDAIRKEMALAKSKTHDVAGLALNGTLYRELDHVIAYYQISNGVNCEFDVDGLTSIDGTTPVGQVILYLNEAKVPAELGPDDWGANPTADADGYLFVKRKLNDDDTVEDLTSNLDEDGKGESAWDVDMVPMEVRCSFMSGGTPMVIRRFIVIGRMNLVY